MAKKEKKKPLTIGPVRAGGLNDNDPAPKRKTPLNTGRREGDYITPGRSPEDDDLTLYIELEDVQTPGEASLRRARHSAHKDAPYKKKSRSKK